jgi:acetyl esterase/lipase
MTNSQLADSQGARQSIFNWLLAIEYWLFRTSLRRVRFGPISVVRIYLMPPNHLRIVSAGLFAMLSFTLSTHAQTRTKTTAPYPTVAKSVSWIVNVPYVAGGGPEQQLDLYIPTDRHGEPLVVFIHGGGFEHGDKAGDSINPNNLQWLWQGYAMASINYRLLQHALWPAQIEDCKRRSVG